MTSIPSVAILLPVKDGDKTLLRCLQSIANQTVQDFEIVLIDDHSKVKVSDRISEFEISLQRIKILEMPSHKFGLADALNLGVENTHCKYIMRMDVDDIMVPQRLEKQIQFLSDNPHIGIVGSFAYKMKHGIKTNKVFRKPIGPFRRSWKFCLNTPFIHPSVIMRSEILRQYKYNPRFVRGQDAELWSRVLGGFQGFNINEPLIYYEVGNGLNVEKMLQKISAIIISGYNFQGIFGIILALVRWHIDLMKVFLKFFYDLGKK